MLESKKTIGLTWEPQLPSLLFGAKSDKSQNVSEGSSSSLVYKPNSELVDGLFVPPNDPKKVNKLLKKQVKDTAGKNWYVNILNELICTRIEFDLSVFDMFVGLICLRLHSPLT